MNGTLRQPLISLNTLGTISDFMRRTLTEKVITRLIGAGLHRTLHARAARPLPSVRKRSRRDREKASPRGEARFLPAL